MPDARTLALLIGASQFPNSPTLGNGDAFENSAQDFRQYLNDPNGLGLPPADVLDLFDDSRPAGTLLDLIIEFLNRRQSKKTSTNVERLLVYYVGHGGFTPVGQEYFLAVRSTRERNEGPSSIRISDLGHIIRDNARFLCQYLILDCCFSAQAYTAFQSGPGDAAVTKTLDSVPKKGTALLCSSGPKEVSLAPENCSHTMFSEALLKALRTGDPALREFLSLSDLGTLIEQNLREVYEDERVRPQVHCPNQPEGDLSDLPLFPNPAFKLRSSGRQRVSLPESTKARIPDEIVSAIRSSLPSVRLVAVKELVELFRTTSSPRVVELVETELSRLSEEDDSMQVQRGAKDGLAECADILKIQNWDATSFTSPDGPTPISDQFEFEQRQQQLIRQELAIAGSIQERLSAIELPDLPYAKVKAVSRACREVGGDFVDCVQSETGLSVVVADISGKGIAAAVVASVLQGILYAELTRDSSLAEMMEVANQFFFEKVGAGKYATVTIVRLQPNGALEIMNCGGIHPIIISGNSVREVEEGSVPIGLIPQAEFTASHLQLEAGDRLLLLTDGVTEAEDSTAEFFGYDRLQQHSLKGFEALIEAVNTFRGDAPLMDDYTMAEITYRGTAKPDA
jgi:Stage II sporulation protein E (SpoIIE)/Caspase domain